MNPLTHRALGRLASASAATLLASAAGAQSIGSIVVTNSSSPPPASGTGSFTTEPSVVAPPSLDGQVASFTHRMAFRNTFIAQGGIAQTNKRNVVYRVDFTVDDPNNTGFLLRVESVMRGVSAIVQVSDEGRTAVATGLQLGVTFDDSTDAPDTFTNLALLTGQITPGVSIVGAGNSQAQQESARRGGIGVYVGTTSFSLVFTSSPTPTTNVFFQNGQTGNGFVYYGDGNPPEGAEGVEPPTLGHFLTLAARFLPGDINADGTVNFADLNAVLGAFGQTGSPGFVNADANEDGAVNFADLNLVLGTFGASF